MIEKRTAQAYELQDVRSDFSLEVSNDRVYIKTRDEYFPLPSAIHKDLFVSLRIREAYVKRKERRVSKFLLAIQNELDCFSFVLGLLKVFSFKELVSLGEHKKWFFTVASELENKEVSELKQEVLQTAGKEGVCVVLMGDQEDVKHVFLALVTPKGRIFRIEAPGSFRPAIVVDLDYAWAGYTRAYGDSFRVLTVDSLLEKALKQKQVPV
jgi:hypothetical protein